MRKELFKRNGTNLSLEGGHKNRMTLVIGTRHCFFLFSQIFSSLSIFHLSSSFIMYEKICMIILFFTLLNWVKIPSKRNNILTRRKNIYQKYFSARHFRKIIPKVSILSISFDTFSIKSLHFRFSEGRLDQKRKFIQ